MAGGRFVSQFNSRGTTSKLHPRFGTLPRLFLAALLVNYVLMGLVLLQVFDRTSVEDTVGYLSGSLAVRDMGGLPGFFSRCLDGTYAEAKQNPLMYLLLYPFAEPSMKFFAESKIISSIIGGLCLASLFFIAAKVWNLPVAYLSTLFLCFGIYFRKRACIVSCEPLMMLILLWAWYFTISGFRNRRAWIPAGFAAGLLYLTKPTGHVFLAAFVVSVPLLIGFRIFKDRYFWYFLVFFIIGAFPLLARNVIGYGTPFYNVNQHILWMDEWDEDLAIRDQPDAFDYLDTHDLSSLLERLEYGVKGEAGNILRLLKPRFHPFAPESVPDAVEPLSTGKFIVILLLLLSPAAVPRRVFLFSSVLFLGFFLPMSLLYLELSSSYYLLPVYPLLLLFLSASLVRILARVPRSIERFAVAAVIILLVLNAAILAGEGGFGNPLDAWSTADGYWELRNWFMQYEGPTVKCVFDIFPDYDYNFDWHTPSNPFIKIIPYPHCGTFECLYDSLGSAGATHLVVTRSNMKSFNLALDDFLHVHPRDGITIIRDPGVWEIELIDSLPPVSFIIFKLGRESRLRVEAAAEPREPEPLIDLAGFLLLCNRKAEAVDLLESIARNHDLEPFPPEDIISTAKLFRRAGMSIEADELLVEALPSARGFEASVLYEMAMPAIKDGDGKRAMELLERAARIPGQFPSPYLASAKQAILAGHPGSAEAPLLRVLARAPCNQDALLTLGEVYHLLHREDQAELHLNLCRMVNPQSDHGRTALDLLPVFPDDNGIFEHDSGYMYIYRPRPFIDSNDLFDSGGKLLLYENGRLLWPTGNVGHDRIETRGEGRYSHWGNIVFFSSSDNSVPQENGRSYTAKVIKDFENPYASGETE